MTNAEKQQFKLDTERAIEIFKIYSRWDERGYDKRFGPLNYKTALSWPVDSPIMVRACVADLALHIRACRNLGCEPTMQSFACILALSEEIQDHLREHDEAEQSEQ